MKIYNTTTPHRKISCTLKILANHIIGRTLSFTKPTKVEWILLALGSGLVFYYSWILDDAYVYFRYVDNLIIHGHGLVYNPGEYVEGFSSPVWIMLLIFLRFFHLDYWIIIRGVGILSFFLVWILLININRKLANDVPSRFIINFPLIHVTLTYAIACYFTSGLETPLVLISSFAYASLFLNPTSVFFQIIVGFSPLIRHELFLPFVFSMIWLYLRNKRSPYVLIFTGVFSIIAWELFRIYYYADLFPNTFYLKNCTWVGQGLRYAYDTFAPYFTLPIGTGFIIIYFLLKRKNVTRNLYSSQRFAMIGSACLVAFYTIKIGGDPRHFRYFAFSYSLLIAATGGLMEILLGYCFSNTRLKYLPALAVVLCFLTFSCYPRQLEYHPIFRGKNNRFVQLIGDAASHRFHKTKITPSLYSLKLELPNLLAIRPEKQFTCDDKKILLTNWCATAYQLDDYFVINQLGLTDPFLARTKMAVDRPAHKFGLIPLAEDLVQLRCQNGFRKGMFADGFQSQSIPVWIEANKEKLIQIEEKIYNHHNFIENLRLAFTHINAIIP